MINLLQFLLQGSTIRELMNLAIPWANVVLRIVEPHVVFRIVEPHVVFRIVEPHVVF